MSKFQVGDTVRHIKQSEDHTVLVSQPDQWGRIVTVSSNGSYWIGSEDVFEPVPKRYVVEFRAVKLGERYAAMSGRIFNAPHDQLAWVIVEALP